MIDEFLGQKCREIKVHERVKIPITLAGFALGRFEQHKWHCDLNKEHNTYNKPCW